MTIFIASDHKGFELKAVVIGYLEKAGYKVVDSGDEKFDPEDDFPVFAAKAATNILTSDDKDARAILICGSGQGMVMAANRIKGIRAGLGWSREAARGIRNDEDSNVLAIPAQLYQPGDKLIFDIIEDFLRTPFAGATRYTRRIKELDNI